MSNDTMQHTPADVRERVEEAWATVEAAVLAQANVLDSHYGGQPAKAAEIRNAVEQVAALLRAPRGEGERGLIMRAMLETFPWSPDIRQEHFERAADAVIAALRSEAQGGGGCGSANVYPTDRSEGDVG